MPTGSSDYGVILSQINETQTVDALETAIRLGAIGSINRTGQQIFELGDAMLYANNFYSSSDGNGNWQASSMYGNFNRPALKVSTSTANGAWAGVFWQMPAFGSKQIGMQSFMICTTFLCTIQMQMYVGLAGVLYKSGIQVNLTNGALSYWKSDASWASIGTFKVPNGIGQPLAIKFTVDYSVPKYKKLYFGNEPWTDISNYVPEVAATAQMDYGQAWVQITNTTAATNAIYMANHVITINEV